MVQLSSKISRNDAFIALTSRKFSVSVSIFLLFYTAIEVYIYIKMTD